MPKTKPKKPTAVKDLKPRGVAGIKATQIKGGTARDAASGQATGRRSYKPITGP